MKLVINRAKWLRGEDAKEGKDSYLLRECDGKQCCIGIYFSALGFKDDELRGLGEDSECIVRDPDREGGYEVDPRVPEWVRRETELYGINDAAYLDEPERERRIAERFAAGGVEVEFVG
jgi:hypothetical protein